MARVTQAGLARHVGVTPGAIARAVREKRIELGGDGLIDLAAGTAMWLSNRRRRPRTPPPAGAGEKSAAAGGGDFWAAKTDREVAEAAMAKMRAAEMRGDLVRRRDIVLEFGTQLINLATALENLAARLAPMMVAETDLGRCQALLRDEHRAALTAFADALDPPQEGDK